MALDAHCMQPKRGDKKERKASWRKYCKERPAHNTAGNNMYLGPSFPELDFLTDVERMLVARVHPTAHVYSARSGRTAYVGLVVNIRNNVGKWYDNLPPNQGAFLYYS